MYSPLNISERRSSRCNKIINDTLLDAAEPQTHKVKHFHARKNCTRREQSHSLLGGWDVPRSIVCIFFSLWTHCPLSQKTHKATRRFTSVSASPLNELFAALNNAKEVHAESKAAINFAWCCGGKFCAGECSRSGDGGGGRCRLGERSAARVKCMTEIGDDRRKRSLLGAHNYSQATAAQTNTRKGIYVCNSSWSCSVQRTTAHRVPREEIIRCKHLFVCVSAMFVAEAKVIFMQD